jgi:rhamnosyltransferase
MNPAAVTITHEPDSAWPERLRAVLNLCARCIVVDNSFTPEARAFVHTTVAASPGAELIANPDNAGLGRALNQGFRVLHAAGHAWVIAFDQDSMPQPMLPSALLATAASSTQPVAVVGANWRDINRPGHISRHLRAAAPFGCGFCRMPATRDLADIICVITSGSLFSLAAWEQLGGFDEGLFVDLVDTDYCLRAHRAGWMIAVSASAALDHQRGAKRPVRFLGRTFYPSFIPPARLHGLSRNRVRLFRRHGGREPAWMAYELVYAAKLLADIIFLEDQKTARLAACLRGSWDGLMARVPAPGGGAPAK